MKRWVGGGTRSVMCYDENEDEEKAGKGLVKGGGVFGFNFFVGF